MQALWQPRTWCTALQQPCPQTPSAGELPPRLASGIQRLTVSDAFNITEDGVTLYAIWNVAEPVMDYGITINRVIRDYNDSGSGDMTFVCSPVPPADDLTPQNLNSSGGDVWCWLDGTTIKFYSEWLAADSSRKLKLNADSSRMFFDCGHLTSIDLSKFDASNVENLYKLFYYCIYLTSIDLSGFDTSGVTTMSSMFNSCYELTNLDVSGFNTSNVTTMENMFHDCKALTSLDVSGFDTSKVTDMSFMFQSCKKLTSLDVRSFDTSLVTNMTCMFCACKNLRTITALTGTNWYKAGLTSTQMFSGCEKLSGYADSNINATYAKVGDGGYFTAP